MQGKLTNYDMYWKKVVRVFFIMGWIGLAALVACGQKTETSSVFRSDAPVPATAFAKIAAQRPRHLSDSALVELVEHQTFRYFWDYAHPVSGLARERSNTSFDYGDEVVTTGGSGFGVMSVVVATERKWIDRDTAVRFLLKMVKFLTKANSYHGVFPHWMDGATGR